MGLVGAGSKIVVIGEVMLELSKAADDARRLNWGGDTANTAVYLARLGHRTDYLSALGNDPYSDRIAAGLAAEGIGTGHLLRHPHRLPGLYAIETDEHGERRFYYWRDRSAARAMFECDGMETALGAAARASCLYLSGITLSILSEADRMRLVALARDLRTSGGAVAFDPNYRPGGWTSAAEALHWYREMAPHVSVVFPSSEDEDLLHGRSSALDQVSRWQEAGIEEVVLKRGRQEAMVSADGQAASVPAEGAVTVVDTTGAGDSFNAGYLSARFKGAAPAEAAAVGHRLAACVVAARGAILERGAMPSTAYVFGK